MDQWTEFVIVTGFLAIVGIQANIGFILAKIQTDLHKWYEEWRLSNQSDNKKES